MIKGSSVNSISDTQRLAPFERPERDGGPLRIVICGDAGAGKSALADRLGETRSVIVADLPGDPRSGPALAIEASTAELAVVVVDASDGVGSEGRRQSLVASLLGVRGLVLAVNKMDQVGYDGPRFDEIVDDFRAFAAQIGLDEVIAVPLSARDGDNLQSASAAMPWYDGPTLLAALESLDLSGQAAEASAPAETTDQFMAHLIWLSDRPMLPERSYVLKLGAQSLPAAITELKHKINIDSLEQLAAKTLERDEIGVCNLALDSAVTYSPFKENRQLGGFLLIDRISSETVGIGTIDYGLRRATNLSWQDYDIDKRSRSAQKRQKPCVLWFTGLSGAGKSTIADLVDKKLHTMGQHCFVLDGDNVRHGLNKDLGFTDADRVENIRRVAEVARLFVDAGLIVLVSFISPFRSERRLAREMMEEGEFVEIFVDTPLDVCEERDPKGLYQKARDGKIANFTGIDSPYEAPEGAEVNLDTVSLSQEEAAAAVIEFLRDRGLV